jgi:lipid-A-disaccharide synthase
MTDANSKRPLIYLIAGEESGDRLGGPLMLALKQACPSDIAFAGVGGPKMTEQGLTSLFPMQDLSVMGLAEVLPRLPSLINRLNQVVADIRSLKPDVLITIDAPDFNFRVARKLKGKGIPLVHYVAPTVWAWRPGRAKKIAGFLDHLLALLPFEPPYFERHGLNCTYVGHPVLQSGAGQGGGAAFRSHHGISSDVPLLALLPGSRIGESSRLLPVFSQTIERLRSTIPSLEIVVPTVAATRRQVEAESISWDVPVHLIDNDKDKYAAFDAADAALAASGTVALELAMAGTPAVIAYKMAPVTGFLARQLVKAPYVNLINLILGREAVPEFLLESCRSELIAPAVAGLLNDAQACDAQKHAYNEALETLGLGKLDPNRRAAETVLGLIQTTKNGAI